MWHFFYSPTVLPFNQNSFLRETAIKQSWPAFVVSIIKQFKSKYYENEIQNYKCFVCHGVIGVFTVEQADAQTTKRAGIKGGLNVSNLYIDDIHDEDARIGMNVGFYGQILSSDAAALQLELLYSTKGADAMYSAGGFNQEVKYNLNYLDLPVLAAIKLGKSAEIH
ncbi:MAG: PorT family protein [Flammeovirgaceae bacterium]|nr:PorT family protein [Flammeovirgaceae bacterium]